MHKMKGIILAGGKATRLEPVTRVVSKQLLPVYDKPMIYYPLSTLMLAGIRDILVISTPRDLPRFQELLMDGSDLGVNFSYALQDQPRGLADAFRVGKEFIGRDNVSLILGDNVFYGSGLSDLLQVSAKKENGATIFYYEVKDPKRYGIVELDSNGKVLSIEEKPKVPKSKFAVVGLYFFDNDVVSIAQNLKPSQRGELEITDVIRQYVNQNNLEAKIMGRGSAWLDTGTFDSMAEASEFVRVVQNRQGSMICCPEEIAFRMGFIDEKKLRQIAEPQRKSGYGEYLLSLL